MQSDLDLEGVGVEGEDGTAAEGEAVGPLSDGQCVGGGGEAAAATPGMV